MMQIFANRQSKSRALLGATAVAAVTLLSACSGQAATPEANSDGGLTTINVGVIPFAELAAYYIGVEQGIFEDEGLIVETTQVSGGAAIVTSLIAGDFDFAYSNYVSLLQAASKGLPISVVRENDRPGVQALYVLPESGISSPKDFEGKTIAVNSLSNIMELTSRAALDSAGVDMSKVSFVELPPPEMNAALEQGQIDAAWLVEPFVTLAKESLDVVIAAEVFEGRTDDLPVAGWATTPQFAAENAETVKAFVRAMDKASQIAHEDPAAVSAIIPSYTAISPEIAAKMSPIAFAPVSDLGKLDILQDLMIEFDYYKDPIDLDDLVWSSGD
ncbi:MAG: hypothetical protein JWP30_686 [Homoserinimonas sp.]|jgi:NitT/TauT family transport system substrate-binding protein|nr:hypothetical protein [Homoserinimonas sp.]